MLIAATSTVDGRRALIIGLEDENMRRLANDEPIRKDLKLQGIEGLEQWHLVILGPEDMARFVAQHRDGASHG